MPPEVAGYADDVTTYDYDPNKAKQLLAQAGESNLTLKFYWPTEVSRPYMPDPKEIFEVISADLQKAGIKIKPVSKVWNSGYLTDVQTGKADLHLLGWTGDYNDAYNFNGTFFGRFKPEFGFTNKAAVRRDREGRRHPGRDPAGRPYKAVNRQIMDFLPAVPLAHSPPSVALQANVKDFVPSPVLNDEFSLVFTVGPVTRPGCCASRTAAAAADPDPVRAVDPAVRLVAPPPGRAGYGPPGGARDTRADRRDQPRVRARPADLGSVLAATCTRIVRFDLGDSIQNGRPVTDVLRTQFPGTIELTIAALIFAVGDRHPAGLLRGPAPGWPAGRPVRDRLADRHHDPGVLPGLPAQVRLRGEAGLAAALGPAGRPHRTPPTSPTSSSSTGSSPGSTTRPGTRSST